MKLLYIDLETTGVRHWKNGLHQISGCIEIDGEMKETFDFKVCPYKDAMIEDEALKVSGVTKETILAYPAMKDVYAQIVSMLSKYVDKYNKTDKFFLVGYNNSSFDNQFLRAFFVQNGDNYFGSYFWSSSLDVMVLATEYLKERRHTMIDFKLKTVASEMGLTIDESRLHDAGYDIELTRNIYRLITAPVEEIEKPF
jgi:DNA polymerase-3 subunit epsilon